MRRSGVGVTVERSNETSLDAKLAPEDFVADVSFAARALLSQPALVIVPVLLWSLPIITAPRSTAGPPHINPWLLLLDFGIVLFSLGWMGAERIFFLRHLQKQPVTVGELLEFVTEFFGRFFRLGLLFGLALFLVVWQLTIHGHLTKSHSVGFRLGLAVFAAVVDFAFTFVPSALAFTTRSAPRALRIGFQMIRQTWPRCGLYVLCPPLALNFVNAIYPVHLISVWLVVTAALAMVGLLAKGATAAFYLRERPTYGPDGAAHITAADEAPALLVQD